MTSPAVGRHAARHLHLIGDGDETDVVAAIEQAFGIRFGAEIERCFTVGDLFAALIKALPPGEEPGRCASAMAFYRLRRALMNHGLPVSLPRDRLVPSVSLAELLERAGMAPQALRDNLEFETGLSLPPLDFARIGTVGASLVLIGLLGLLVSPIFGVARWVPLALGVAGGWMLWLDPRRFAEKTLGELARATADRSFARLVGEGADGRETAMWKTFTQVIRAQVPVLQAEITPATLLIDPDLWTSHPAGTA